MLASRPQSLDATVSVETPEHVAFSYSIAGIGARAAAALIDYLICVALLMAFVFIWGVQGPWAVAVVVIVQFVIVWGYYVLFEGLNDGQTPGKRWLRLRVVQDGGYSVSFAASAVRNLARVVDLQPVVTYAVGVVSIAATKSGKRIGDLLAGTIVVRERAERRRVAAGPAPADAPVVLHTLLTDDEYALVARFIERRDALDKSRRAILERSSPPASGRACPTRIPTTPSSSAHSRSTSGARARVAWRRAAIRAPRASSTRSSRRVRPDGMRSRRASWKCRVAGSRTSRSAK